MKIEARQIPPRVEIQRDEVEQPFNKELSDVSKQFEAVLVNQMVQAMRSTVTQQGIIPQSQGEKIYRSMLDSEYSQKMADTEQLGLGRIIYDQLLRKASME